MVGQGRKRKVEERDLERLAIVFRGEEILLRAHPSYLSTTAIGSDRESPHTKNDKPRKWPESPTNLQNAIVQIAEVDARHRNQELERCSSASRMFYSVASPTQSHLPSGAETIRGPAHKDDSRVTLAYQSRLIRPAADHGE